MLCVWQALFVYFKPENASHPNYRGEAFKEKLNDEVRDQMYVFVWMHVCVCLQRQWQSSEQSEHISSTSTFSLNIFSNKNVFFVVHDFILKTQSGDKWLSARNGLAEEVCRRRCSEGTWRRTHFGNSFM